MRPPFFLFFPLFLYFRPPAHIQYYIQYIKYNGRNDSYIILLPYNCSISTNHDTLKKLYYDIQVIIFCVNLDEKRFKIYNVIHLKPPKIFPFYYFISCLCISKLVYHIINGIIQNVEILIYMYIMITLYPSKSNSLV